MSGTFFRLKVTSKAYRAKVQLLEFHSDHGEREVLTVSPDHPAPLCLRKIEQPAWWARPVTKVRLRLKYEESSTEAPQSSFWSLLRTHAAPSRLQLSVRTGPPGLFCHLLGKLGPIASGICRDCSERCPAKASPVVGSHDLAVSLPPEGGCVYIAKLPDGVQRAHAEWDLNLDMSVFGFLFAGLVLVWSYELLQESAALHAGMGGFGAVMFIAIMVFFWFVRGVRGTVHGTVPFGRSATTFATMVFALVPAARDAMLGWIVKWLPAADWKSWLSLRDPWYNLPIGWLAVLLAVMSCVSLVVLGAKLSVKYFASYPEPSNVEFTVASDGRRIDQLPPAPLQQRLLGWLFWLLGVTFLLTSTHCDGCSLTITMLVLLKDYVWHFIQLKRMELAMSNEPQPHELRSLMSSSEMQQQARINTEKALAGLRQHIQANPGLTTKFGFREDTELRLRRFADGFTTAGIGVQEPLETEPARRSWFRWF